MPRRARRRHAIARARICLALGGLVAVTALAETAADDPRPRGTAPAIAIVIDDLGDRLGDGMRVLRLRGPVAASILPHTPYSRILAERASASGKEVILHMPMEARGGEPLGRGALTADMTRAKFVATLNQALDSIPNVIAVSNHMGSLLTQLPDRMDWLMDDLERRGGLFFIDSRTVAGSVAYDAASAAGVPRLKRDVFLDNDPSPAAIQRQFYRLIERARRSGRALAIGHPHPQTLLFLEQALPGLQAMGVELVPVSRLLASPPRPAPGPAMATFATVTTQPIDTAAPRPSP